MNNSVSIITPSYNSSEFISSTIRSVISQSHHDWEMIIVDDCSSDSSVKLIQSFVEHDSRIKLIQLSKNSGAAVARNKGIEVAQGRYIAFLDSDDLWLSNKLEIQLSFMQSNDYPFCFSAYDKIDENSKVIGCVGVPDKVNYYDLLKMCSIGCLTSIYDTKYFGKVYMPTIRKRQDLGLWLRLLKYTDCAHGLNVTLAQYRVRKGSISANKINAAMFTWRLYRDVERLNLINACYYFTHYALNGFLRTKSPGLARLLGILK
ncbi:glycosyltransferase family 2 protein [Marinomonas sp. TW1]|uniref:glycosyltransferase family 2 protein n=1 Tax=Marinomonas sp. TW1 TaxID=1561203 RepID=UPI0007AF5516|nr:glycosyltransferase family 2 protein [Marinomonas sp. TW1]KZN15063.1 glycosyl transferase [Marinomonas sp. TW1]